MKWVRRFGQVARSAVGVDDSTRRAMHGMRITLFVLSLVVLVTTVWSTAGLRSTVDEVRTRTAPGLLDVASAREALVTADQAAVDSFRSGTAQQVGPGSEYQNALAVANQDLARAAQNGVAGGAGVQFLAGLLTVYSGWMGEADAYSRGSGDSLAGLVNLWYASRLLHNDDEGILKYLDELAASQSATMDQQLTTGWLDPLTALIWLVPALLLLAALIRAQVFLARRFRRRLSPWLVGATALLIALMLSSAPWAQPGGDTRAAAEALKNLVPDPQKPEVLAPGEAAALQWVSSRCVAECGDTVALQGTVAAATPQIDPAEAAAVTAGFSEAGDAGWLPVLIPVLGSAVVLFALLGFQRRISEYGYP
ncbi:hypothetical protein LWC34_46565 [Kibdelosporangium philippinense]|uniref:Integral membrane protein n=1 Tax=Kibdelosporangium philippinense TaxID=211113 RepID=A0ABS8ZR40_9PSEU|nr:hypothetical protein [Kibdelosporangium philippinense]MCE7010219.1 hypothetical protein [Kibdelosporangium philippinense]